MKKTILCFAALAVLLTACDPEKDSNDFNIDSYSSDQLADMVSFEQFSMTDSVTPQSDGNWFHYTTNPAQLVQIYTYKSDGSENILSGTGSHASGSFLFRPTRGSDPNQVLHIRYINAKGETVEAEKQVTVEVASELNPEIRLLASNDYGSKVWKWDTDWRADGGTWGNLGYLPGTGESFAKDGNGIWFSCPPADLKGQLQHATDGNGEKYANADAYMVLDDEGGIKSYTADGTEIASGSYNVVGYDGSRHASADGSQADWSLGTLHTTAGTILWPYQINGKGFKPEDFEIMQLDATHLKLIYAASGAAAWDEATWWAFKSESDAKGALTDYDTKSWTWDTDWRADGGAWGNLGYLPGTGESFASEGNGIWFACPPADLSGQMEHAGSDPNGLKYADPGVYMTFNYATGGITAYDKDGKEIAKGSWDIPNDSWNNGKRDVANNWSMGTLTTSKGAILWPYKINSKGEMPTSFDVLQLDGNHLKLVYAAPGTAAWSEATWWAFKKK